MPASETRSAYFHVPFCRHRCGYCNFALVADRDYLIDRFLQAIDWEIRQTPQTQVVDTIYLGGGTPTHLNDSQLKRLFDSITSRFEPSDRCEITIEANPNDLLPERSEFLAGLGVNRVSLGVQSFHPAKLQRLDRTHQRHEVLAAVQAAGSFAASVSVDLIFAAPEESLEQWQADLEELAGLKIQHVSAYELTYEKGTLFWNRRTRGDQSEADEELRLSMYLHAIERLEKLGFRQYEISSFAQEGHESRHNSVYWSGSPFFAFGPGAAGYLDAQRYQNVTSPMQYMKMIERGVRPIKETENLSILERARELLAIGLRRLVGVQESHFKNVSGVAMHDVAPRAVERLLDWKLLETSGETLRLTRAGLLLYDNVAAEIVNGEP